MCVLGIWLLAGYGVLMCQLDSITFNVTASLMRTLKVAVHSRLRWSGLSKVTMIATPKD